MQKLFITIVIFSSLLCAAAATAQEVGMASFYHDFFNGKRTASGELYDSKKLTAAHKTLPIGTMIKVTNLANNKSIVVRVNDRGPYVRGRVLDVSRAAADQLGFVAAGSAQVSCEVLNNTIEIKDTMPVSQPKDILYMITEVDTSVIMQYGVKLGSYEDPKVAFNVTKEIRAKYHAAAYIQNTKLVKGSLYRIYVGNYATQEEAEKLRSALKKNYPDSKVVKYDGMK